MGIRILYECDKCQKRQPNNEQMWEITIFVSHHGQFVNPHTSPNARKKMLWCRECCDGLELVADVSEATRKSQDLPPPPTAEDLLRQLLDIVRPETDR